MSDILFSSLDLTHDLSFVHYNVQSIYSKLEILEAELFEFDILPSQKHGSALLLTRVSYCCTHLIPLRERIENMIATGVS